MLKGDLLSDLFVHPGHSYSNLPPINYWREFPTQTNFLKQDTYADFAISQKEQPVCSVFCKVYVHVKKPTHCVLFCKLVYEEANLLPLIVDLLLFKFHFVPT